MRKAEVRDGVVVNVIEIDPSNVPEWCADWPDADADARIGALWNGSTFCAAPVDADAVAVSVRVKRNELLRTIVDPIAGNILRWSELHPLKQQEVIEYRKALLDIPQQVGFPLKVEWPPVLDI